MSETSIRWRRVEEICQEALDRPLADRAAFLAAACTEDVSLRQEVEALLVEEAAAATFLESPVGAVAAAAMTPGRARLSGRRVGVFDVGALLGTGGMGEVYRARDTRLDRDVAIKILPEAFTADPDRIARFEREAKVLASLNHPNIAIVYGFEHTDGTYGLVMELVEGEDLAQRIGRGAMPVEEALPVAKQIADALEAAHEQNIIHRDLKPANVKVRPDGTVKVLDFGLAKAMEPSASSGVSHSPTLTTSAPFDLLSGRPEQSRAPMTHTGMILGTVAYISPERAKGNPADKRGDIWAFGCVLYEMLTGRPAFDAENVPDTLTAVLKNEPDWTALPTTTPARVAAVLRRCLEKDRKRRARDIGDVSLMLEGAFDTTVPREPEKGGAPTAWRRALSLAALILAVVLLSAAAWQLSRATAPLRAARFSIALPEGTSLAQMTRQNLAISPDGTQIVYASDGRLFSRALGDFAARALAGTGTFLNISNPAFSADGRSVVFFSDRAIKRVGLEGGVPLELCPADPPSGLTWDATGILVGQGMKGIFRCPTTGGALQQLVTVKDGDEAYGPQLLPGTDLLLFTVGSVKDGAERWEKAHVVIESLSSRERTTLIRGGRDARYLPTGHLIYGLRGRILAAPFDPGHPSEIGEAEPVVDGVQMETGSAGVGHFVTSDVGTLLYLPGLAGGPTHDRTIAVSDRAGTVERLSLPSGPYVHVRASRDGRFLAIGSDDTKEAIVSIFPLDGTSSARRLTFEGKNRFPVWSLDGRVAFQSDRDGDLGILVQRADGTGATERLTQAGKGEAHTPESWSPDGKTLLFTVQQSTTFSLWSRWNENGKAAPLGDVRSSEPIDPVFSPDGRWIAYRVRTGKNLFDSKDGVYVQPFPPTGEKYQAPRLIADFHPVWTPSGDALVYVPSVNSGRQAIVPVMKARGLTFGVPMLMPAIVTGGVLSSGRRAYDVLPDGRFIGLVTPGDARATVGAPNQIRVVLNWYEELKRLVPTK